ncbi:chromate efflux transporter [Pseudoxanthomonas mexicana]|uniref:chromate efflux transporter n=1 Tax=Pseudoxanthomonas mexicana TaxID=128785 RepID=UPI0028A12841|nr:chromate efflux transporter [Pseudoxanthomonas mexicana]
MRGTTAGQPRQRASTWAVFRVFLGLGLVSFGGPIAHLGYFRDAFVARRQWLTDSAYAELVALCQFLPGPASSQVGMAIGLSQAGIRGAVAAWCGFTAPSALLMVALGASFSHWRDVVPPGVLHGLKLLAVVVVTHAVWGMARAFCRTPAAWGLMLGAAALLLIWPSTWMQVGVIVLGALAGLGMPAGGPPPPLARTGPAGSRRTGIVALSVFVALLVIPWRAAGAGSMPDVFGLFYRAGSLVFGGGHVVMPLLQEGVVAPGWVTQEVFLAGYGAAQAVPGPMFTFAGYLGAAMEAGRDGWVGGALALVAIFLPSFLLVVGVLPFWQRIAGVPRMRAVLAGINAAVVGLLLAALCGPLRAEALRGIADLIVVIVGVVALVRWRVPTAWLVLAAPLAGMLALALR